MQALPPTTCAAEMRGALTSGISSLHRRVRTIDAPRRTAFERTTARSHSRKLPLSFPSESFRGRHNLGAFSARHLCHHLTTRRNARAPVAARAEAVDPGTLVGDHPAFPPPYDMDALVQYGVSERSLRAHVDHYLDCLQTLNRQLDADDILKRLTLDDLIKSAYNNGNPLPCFNWAAETWNHEFFWTSINPEGGDRAPPSTEIVELLDRDFGGLLGFKRQFKAAALSSFGSCWIWLSAKVDTLVPEEWLRDLPAHNPYRLTVAKLTIEKTSNALNPHVFDRIPLLSLDMWEHAYLADFKTDREAYVDAFLNKLVSWDTVAARMENAKAFVNFTEMPTPKESLFRPGYAGDYRLADAPITQEKAMEVLSASKGKEE